MKFVNEGVIEIPIESQKPDTKFGKPKLRSKPTVKDITKPKPRPDPSKTAFKEAEAKAEANNF